MKNNVFQLMLTLTLLLVCLPPSAQADTDNLAAPTADAKTDDSEATTLVTLVVSTANAKASGTDAATRAILIGTKGTCEISLDEKGIDNHKRGGADIFSDKTCPNLGKLNALMLWHAPYNARGEKASWKVDDVSILYKDPTGNVVQLVAEFHCWIGGTVTKPLHLFGLPYPYGTAKEDRWSGGDIKPVPRLKPFHKY